jgi:hypothetical protein
VDREIGAQSGKPFGECPAEAATGAGDQCDVALERARAVV